MLSYAIGWPPGIKALLRAGAEDRLAIRTAIQLHDIESVKILLNADLPLYEGDLATRIRFPGSDSWDHTDLSTAIGEGSVPLIELIAQSTADRRKKLKELAWAHLSTKQREEYRIGGDHLPDFYAFPTYSTLIGEGVEVPISLQPGYGFSVFHTVSARSPFGGCLSETAGILYKSGFRLIDFELDGTIPLLKALQSFHLWDGTAKYYLVQWYVERDASLVFSSPSAFPTALFYIAMGIPNLHSKMRELFPLQVDTIKKIAKACDPFYQDSCTCFCSTSGCLATHGLFYSWRQELKHR
jgi:hypothetical protein